MVESSVMNKECEKKGANVPAEVLQMIEQDMPARDILQCLSPELAIPDNADDMMLWKLINTMIDAPKRKKLTQYNTLDDAVQLIKRSKNIVVLTGAGISTAAGIPDFRSKNGIYDQIRDKFPDWDDPKLIFHLEYLKKDPTPFYHFAKALYPPGDSKGPTGGHKFIKCIEDHGKLLRNYVQNIDALESAAGITRFLQCHGTIATMSCTNCQVSVDAEPFKDDILNERVPWCPKCNEPGVVPTGDGAGVMRPDFVFFGDQLKPDFYECLDADKNKVDLLIVIGTSLLVRPVALLPSIISPDVPQILINRELLDHMDFDIELLGSCNRIVEELCFRLGGDWKSLCGQDSAPLKEIVGLPASVIEQSKQQQQQQQQQQQPAPVQADQKSDSDCGKKNAEYDMPSDYVMELPREKASIVIPEHSFYLVKPNRYLFEGAEPSVSQMKRLIEDSSR